MWRRSIVLRGARPHYVLGLGLAMPHARPEDGVNWLGLALTVLKEGSTSGLRATTRCGLLVTLAASDSNSHVETIAQLAELFMNEEDVAGHHGGHQQRRHPGIPAALLRWRPAPDRGREHENLVVADNGLGTSLMMEMSIKSTSWSWP